LIDDEPLLAVSGSNVFIMGTAFGSNATFGPFTVSFPGGAGQYFARYNTNGTPQLAVGFGSPTTIPWTTLADSSGNVYVGGDFDTYSVFGSNLIAAPHQDSIGNGYSSQGFLAKFDANGNPLWARLAQSQNNYVNVRGLTLANDGVWGCGLFKSPTSFGTNTIFSASSCVGSPTCFLTYHVSGFLAKITDATVVSNPAITLVNPQVSGVNFQFQFLSQTGKTHLVLSRTNIVLGNWVTNSTISGDGTIKTVSVPKASPKETYFRVFTP
jgi:hypothetical protein